MKLSRDVKSVSYLKAHASEVIREVNENRRTMVITQRGEAKVVLQDAAVYDDLMESLALLRMLAQSRKSVSEGRAVPLPDAATLIRERTAHDPEP